MKTFVVYRGQNEISCVSENCHPLSSGYASFPIKTSTFLLPQGDRDVYFVIHARLPFPLFAHSSQERQANAHTNPTYFTPSFRCHRLGGPILCAGANHPTGQLDELLNRGASFPWLISCTTPDKGALNRRHGCLELCLHHCHHLTDAMHHRAMRTRALICM